jgi:hypothetical protein
MLSCATWFRIVVIVGSVMLGVASAKAADSKSVEHAAHDAYVSAINSNNPGWNFSPALAAPGLGPGAVPSSTGRGHRRLVLTRIPRPAHRSTICRAVLSSGLGRLLAATSALAGLRG